MIATTSNFALAQCFFLPGAISQHSYSPSLARTLSTNANKQILFFVVLAVTFGIDPTIHIYSTKSLLSKEERQKRDRIESLAKLRADSASLAICHLSWRDDSTLLAVSHDGTAHVWSCTTSASNNNEMTWKAPTLVLLRSKGPALCAAWNADKSAFVVGMANGSLAGPCTFDSDEQWWTCTRHVQLFPPGSAASVNGEAVMSVDWRGDVIAAGSRDGRLVLMHVPSLEIVKTCKIAEPVLCVAISPDQAVVAACPHGISAAYFWRPSADKEAEKSKGLGWIAKSAVWTGPQEVLLAGFHSQPARISLSDLYAHCCLQALAFERLLDCCM